MCVCVCVCVCVCLLAHADRPRSLLAVLIDINGACAVGLFDDDDDDDRSGGGADDDAWRCYRDCSRAVGSGKS